MVDYEVAVVGAGPVGLAFAGWLAQQESIKPEQIAVFDSKPLAVAQNDPRVLAISESTRQSLLPLGFPAHAQAITQIHVSEKGRLGQVRMSSQELGLEALGWTLRYGDLMTCLAHSVQSLGVQIFRPKVVLPPQSQPLRAYEQLQLEDGSTLKAYLRVDAEGGVYGQQEQRDVVVDYSQYALVSEVKLRFDGLSQGFMSGGLAFERFCPSGPLALLPLMETHSNCASTASYSLVWCASHEIIQRLSQVSEDEFFAELEALFSRRFRVIQMKSRQTFRLGLNYRQNLIKGRCVYSGNAAQILHPVAGQGLNLGLRDAYVLASLLSNTSNSLVNLQDTLAQFNLTRKFDRQAVARASDLLVRLFSNENKFLGCGRQAALCVMESLPWLRRQFAQAMLFGFKT